MNAQAPRLRVFLYEGAAVDRLGPVAQTRPAFELRVGLFNLRERIESIPGLELVGAEVRPHLAPLAAEGLAAEADAVDLRLDARLDGATQALADALTAIEPGDRWVVDGEVVAERPGAPVRDLPLPRGVSLVERPWQIVHRNAERIVDDHRWVAEHGSPVRRIFGVRFREGSGRDELLAATRWSVGDADGSSAILLGADRILIGEGVRIRAGAVLDAESGPIVLGAGCIVHPGAVVVGPAYLGPGTVVNPGAKLREGTSLGAFCKVGGEVEETVMLDLSNKQHDGFLGHALVGSWVNLGADTNGSDLKNNYGNVKVDLGDGIEDSGETFVGPHFGDHAKTGINTMLTTGCVVGVAANVFGGDFGPRHFPAFTWGGALPLAVHRFEAAVETARIVCSRRDALFEQRHEDVLRWVFDRTAGRRATDCVD